VQPAANKSVFSFMLDKVHELFLDAMASKLVLKRYNEDMPMRNIGEKGDTIFFLVRGQVASTNSMRVKTHTYTAPAVIGESAVVSFNAVYKESLKAKDDCELYELSSADIVDLQKAFPEYERIAVRACETELQNIHQIFVTKCMIESLKCTGAGFISVITVVSLLVRRSPAGTWRVCVPGVARHGASSASLRCHCLDGSHAGLTTYTCFYLAVRGGAQSFSLFVVDAVGVV